jgi:ribosomal protein S6--L-glutamate ligase
MTIGILIFSEPTESIPTGSDRFTETGEELGHQIIKLYEPYLSFIDGSIFHKGEPLPHLDIIISRPNFVEEPSLHTYAVQLLEQAGYKIINGQNGFTWAKNKLTQHVLFQQHHLPCPRWGIARNPEDAIRIANQIGFPSIVKVAFGTHGKGVFYAPNEETLRPIVDYLAIRDGNPLIIESFIEEARCNDLRVYVVNGNVVASMQRKAINGEVRANASLGAVGSTVNLTQEEEKLAIRAAEIFELKIAGVDLIRSAHGPLILEINGNPGFKELERVTNLNLAKIILEYAIDQI